MHYLISFFHWWTTSRTEALISFVALIVATISVVIALLNFRQIRDSQIESARPIMQATLLPPTKPEDDLSIEVTNVGRTEAKNIKFEFIPPLPDNVSLDKLNSESLRNKHYSMVPLTLLRQGLLEKEHKSWAPGFKASFPYWVIAKDAKFEVSGEGVMANTILKIYYEGYNERKYDGDFVLDPSIYRGKIFSPTENERIVKELKSIRDEIKRGNTERNL
ncbi:MULTISPECIES: hypothetical protein [Corynebacterium]|uniref:hypothetical protein n=1 Tax=Corynebacterium TaxID=1716 RepID=UPI00114CBCF6|nr:MULTISPECIES: hypothetical protein [Corynebacterium]MDK7111134.1 hypothetical protein [Corynebacterium amycolatum]MDK7146234.1 hypothetical protein [Corynebacterium amycolatum]